MKAFLKVVYALSLLGIWGCLFFYGRVAWNLGKAFWQAGVEGLLQYSLIANWPGFNGQQKLIAVYFRLLVDTLQQDLTRHEFHQNGWELRGVNLTRVVSLSAGQHTVAVEWYTTDGTASACWYGDTRQIQVIEL